MIAVFGYNEKAIKFYPNNGFHVRMLDMIENEQIIKEGEDLNGYVSKKKNKRRKK